MKRSSRGVGDDLVSLQHAHLITLAETEKERGLAEAVIKQLTGGDSVKARALYSKYKTFRFVAKIIIATNHRPAINDDSHGTWRRLRLIPFTIQIPDHEQDRELETKLMAEASGIFNWMLKGLQLYREEGLDAPIEVTAATEEWKGDSSPLRRFLADEYVETVDDKDRVGAQALNTQFNSWATANGERTISSRLFKDALEEIGYGDRRLRSSGNWFYTRLKSLQTVEEENARSATVYSEDPPELHQPVQQPVPQFQVGVQPIEQPLFQSPAAAALGLPSFPLND